MKKGFTLIELLAVILILGIIALIAIPTVTIIIESSKKGAAITSTKQFIKSVDEYIVSSQIYENQLLDGVYNVEDLLELDLAIKGDVPTDGMVFINNGVVKDFLLKVDDYSVSYSNGSYTSYNKLEKFDYGKEVYFNPTTGEKCDGKVVDSKVGNTSGCLRWYVLNDNGDYIVDLLLDHNIKDFLAWNSQNTTVNGPDSEFLNTLKNLTDSWKGVPIRKDSYSYSAKVNYTINYSGFRARIPSANEIARASGNTDYEETVNTSELNFREDSSIHFVVDEKHWLYDNLYNCGYYGCKKQDNGTYGYWLSSVSSFNNTNALAVEWEGCIRYYRLSSTNNRDGIRPVISILKSSILD